MPSAHTPATSAHSMSPGGRGCECDGCHCPRNEDKGNVRHLRGPTDIENQNDDGVTPGLPRVRRSQAEERGPQGTQLAAAHCTAAGERAHAVEPAEKKCGRDAKRHKLKNQHHPAANAHGASSTEQQDMLDKGLDMLQQMRAGFGME